MASALRCRDGADGANGCGAGGDFAPDGSGASPSIGTTRLRALPRCCMRLTTSWPTKQPLSKETPLSRSKSASCGKASPKT